jgi:hypothetical protein
MEIYKQSKAIVLMVGTMNTCQNGRNYEAHQTLHLMSPKFRVVLIHLNIREMVFSDHVCGSVILIHQKGLVSQLQNIGPHNLILVMV